MSKGGSGGAAVVGRLRSSVLRWAFALLYRFGGRIYDPLTVALFHGAWDEWRSSTLDFLLPGRVLDLGCGTGALLELLATGGYAAFGVEREPSMLRVAHRRAGPLVRADAAALPFLTAGVDNCVATYPAPFILEPAVQNEIARVLRPGGRVVVLLSGTPDPGTLTRLLRPFIDSMGYDREWTASPLLSHPLLEGRWEQRRTPRGTAHIWVGNRLWGN